MVPCVLRALEYCQLCTRSLPKRHGLVHIWQCTSVRSTPGVIPNGHGYAVPGHYRLIIERFCKTKMCTNFRSTSQSEKLRTNFRNFGRETCREREMNFRRKFREIGSWRTCTWRMQTTKMCRTQSSCENSYTFSQGLSRNFVRIFVVQNLSNALVRWCSDWPNASNDLTTGT